MVRWSGVHILDYRHYFVGVLAYDFIEVAAPREVSHFLGDVAAQLSGCIGFNEVTYAAIVAVRYASSEDLGALAGASLHPDTPGGHLVHSTASIQVRQSVIMGDFRQRILNEPHRIEPPSPSVRQVEGGVHAFRLVLCARDVASNIRVVGFLA